jgi:hypothetical protein
LEDPVSNQHQKIFKAVLEDQKGSQNVLWYGIPEDWAHCVTDKADPFAVGTIFSAMARGGSLQIHGPCSRTLLTNLEEFQKIWSSWFPEIWSRISLEADLEQDPETVSPSEGALLSFSGGLDSSFSAWNHFSETSGRKRFHIQAAVMVHGFDIPLYEAAPFENAAAKAKNMLQSLNIPLITVSSNFRDHSGRWDKEYAAAVASTLMLFQNCFAKGIIASGRSYSHKLLVRGSNPFTDPLLSSGRMTISHDGAGYSRCQKAKKISEWPEALQFLRICWEDDAKDKNCGNCEKCIRTILNFRASGIPLPQCFDRDVQDQQILALKNLSFAQLSYYKEILQVAKSNGINSNWIFALDECIRKNTTQIITADLYRYIKRKFGIRSNFKGMITRWSSS